MQNRVICDKATLDCKRKNCRVARLHDPQPNWQNIKFTCKDINPRYKAKEECSYKEIEWKELRDYQRKLAYKTAVILNSKGLAYLACQPRVGKTYIDFEVPRLAGAKKVYFFTTPTALTDIMNDWDSLRDKPDYEIEFANYEMLHKYLHVEKENDRDTIIIIGEAQKTGAYPDQNTCTEILAQVAGKKRILYESGTPTPEGYTQIFNQLKISAYTPFCKSFYKWAKEYVDVVKVKRYGMDVNDYKKAKKELIFPVIEPYFVTYTREQAGFQYSEVEEKIFEVDMNPGLKNLILLLKEEKVYHFKTMKGRIVSDSAVKLMDHIHQLCSGTIICHKGEYQIIDDSKAKFIAEKYKGQKIAILYNYISEGELIKRYFPNWTSNHVEFKLNPEKTLVANVESVARGTDLSSAEYIVMFSINHSAEIYIQVANRLLTRDRDTQPEIHYIFNKNVKMEHDILACLAKKMDYTLAYFKKSLKSL